MLEVRLEGTPYDMGRQHGSADPQIVKDTIEVKFRVKERLSGTPGFEEGIAAGEQKLQAWRPGLIEEMRGIADGAGLPYRDVLIHNLYSYLGVFKAEYEARECCSCAGFARTAHGPIVGKTNDNTDCGIATHVLATCYPAGGTPYIQLSYVGMASCFAGMNQHGLAIGGASVAAGERGEVGDLLFISWMVRTWLEGCATVVDVIESARAHRIFSGANFLMADVTGGENSFAHLEYFEPDNVFVRLPVDNCLFLTNHPVTEDGKAMDRQTSPEAKANSLGRFQALEKLIREVPQTPEGVKKMMSTHSSPARICQHKGVDGASLDTDMALVFVPQERTIYYSKGHPCESGYEEVWI